MMPASRVLKLSFIIRILLQQDDGPRLVLVTLNL